MKMPSVPGFSIMGMLSKLMKPMEGMSGGSMQEQLENKANANARKNRADRRREEREEQRANREAIRAEKARERAIKEAELSAKRQEREAARAERESKRQENTQKRIDNAYKKDERQKLREDAAEQRRVKKMLQLDRQREAAEKRRERDRQRTANQKQQFEKKLTRIESNKKKDLDKLIKNGFEMEDIKSTKWVKDVEWLQRYKDKKRRAEKEAELMESLRGQGHFVFYSGNNGWGWIEGKDLRNAKGEIMDAMDDDDKPEMSEDDINNLFR